MLLPSLCGIFHKSPNECIVDAVETGFQTGYINLAIGHHPNKHFISILLIRIAVLLAWIPTVVGQHPQM
jgi:hypothetical protein